MELKDRLQRYLDKEPRIHTHSYIAEQACIIGDVSIAKDCSIWPNVVMRADINAIEIGEGSNIQDGSVLHLSDDYGVKIGQHTTVGHMSMLHACEIGNECLIGMHSTILDGAIIGEQSIIGAHCLVTKETVIPAGSLVMGVPGKIIRALQTDERKKIREWAEKYVEVSKAYRARNR